MVVKTKALVLRAVPVGEQDRILTLLSSDYGVISVSARGAAKSGNRMAAVAQPLMYGEYLLFRGASRYSLNGADILTSFFDLALEPERYELAVRLLSYAEDAGMVPESASEVLELTLHLLHRMIPGHRREVSPDLLKAAYLMKMMQIAGLAPHITGCTRCGTTAIDSIRFSHDASGFLCETCDPADPSAVPVAPGVAKAMLYTLCAPVDALFRFELEPTLVAAYAQLAERYADQRWEKRPPRSHSVYTS